MYMRVTVSDSAGDPPPREDCNEENKENKKMRPPCQHPPQHVCIAPTSITNADTQRTWNHKMAKRQMQLIHQLRIYLLLRLNRAELRKCRLIHLYHHPVWSSNKKKYGILVIRNEQRLKLKTLPFACWPDPVELAALSIQHGDFYDFVVFT